MNNLQKDFDNLLFGVRRSVRYHSHRQGFFRRWHRLVLFIALLFGSATFAVFITEIGDGLIWWGKLLPAALVTTLTALDLVVGFSDKAWNHADLVRKFTVLEQQLERGRTDLTQDLIVNVTNQRLEIEVTEPRVLQVLDTICHNELTKAMGYEKEEQVEVKFWQRLFANIVDIQAYRLFSSTQS